MTTTATTTPAPTTWTNTAWATALLATIGAPITSNNINNVLHWMSGEEPSSDWWDRNNPLNASAGTSASDGTGSYPSLEAAVVYTAQMINQSNMSPIKNALMSDASLNDFSLAAAQSCWTGCPPAGELGYGDSATYIADTSPTGGVSADQTITVGFWQKLGTAAENAFAATIPGGGVLKDAAQAAGGAASSADDVGTLIKDVTDLEWWKRFALGAAGVALIIVGLATFVATSEPGQKATQTAETLAPLALTA